MKNPCTRDCPARSATCHAECERYAEWAKQNEELRMARHKEVDKVTGFIEHHRRLNAITRRKRRKG